MTPEVKGSPLGASALETTRRRFLAVATAAGLGQTLLPGALLALASTHAAAQTPAATKAAAEEHEAKLAAITPEMIEQAALLAGLTFTEAQRKVMIDGLTGQRDDIVEVRKLSIPNAVAPALVFN